jgi:hypothetical protein
LYAQNSTIEQARLFEATHQPQQAEMTADGMALPGSASSSDDSFGEQQILKIHQPLREWVVSGDAAFFFTSNAALTRNRTDSDAFVVANGEVNWNHAINNQLQIQAGAQASIFRYTDSSALDFENLDGGLGLAWTSDWLRGVVLLVRYDFIELLDKHSRELLRDNEFSVSAQKTFSLSRAHALVVGAIAAAGISDPFSAQRDQIGAFVSYRLALGRKLDADASYRISGFFYNGGGRDDVNQIFSAGLLYHLTSWADANALVSFGTNRSTRGSFEYNVFTTGAALGFTVRF